MSYYNRAKVKKWWFKCEV